MGTVQEPVVTQPPPLEAVSKAAAKVVLTPLKTKVKAIGTVIVRVLPLAAIEAPLPVMVH